MIAAIYARRSNEQSGVADEQKSVARQIDHAREYATRKNWTVVDEHVYSDDGIGGAEFSARPGFVRLLNAVKPRTPFNILIVSELSRLGREQLETGFAVKQLSQAGVQIVSYLEDKEIALDTPIDKFLMSAVSFAAEIEREKARQRTYDAMLRKARAGDATGGRAFGFDHLRKDTGGVRRVINEAEAIVVRRIFTLASEGHGFTTITKTLNAEGAPSPRPQRGRPAAWAPSSVREVLHRSLYRGVITWNMSRKRTNWGQKHQQPRPSTEWIHVPAPELAIVDEALWTAAHAQMDRQRARYKGVSPRGGPPWGVEAKYLLTGLLSCADCGGGFEVRSRQHGTRRVHFYGCASYHRRGRSVCGNSLTMPIARVDEAIELALERALLYPRFVTEAIRRATLEIAAPADRESPLAEELARLDLELARLTTAVVQGGALPTLVAAIAAREADRRTVVERMQRVPTKTPTLDEGAIRATLRTWLTNWRSLVREDVPGARTLLKQLIVGRLKMRPDPANRTYRFDGVGTMTHLLAGLVPVVPQCVASPTGFASVWTMPIEGTIARAA